jgi:(R,R)-butanediol dehydrogenase/meso-butanediol dehydrogenase/diacetyl reductase
MRAAIYQSADIPLQVGTIPDPQPEPDQVIIKVSRAGICGSDLHVKRYGLAPAGAVFGHEFAGTIVEAGGATSGWSFGERVTALPIMPCRDCEACDAHLPALCRNVAFVGTGVLHGAYANYVAVRGDQVQKLPSGIDFSEGAMVEPLAVAHHAVDRAGLVSGQSVLVMGGGPIGLGVALFARLAGARKVVVSEPSVERRAHALELGATITVDPRTQDVGADFEAHVGHAPDIVFECVGNPGLISQAVSLVRLRGQVVVAGVCFEDDKITPLVALGKEISVRFVQCYTERDFSAVIDAIATGRVNVKPMHSRTVSLVDLPAVFEELSNDARDCKVLLDPEL